MYSTETTKGIKNYVRLGRARVTYFLLSYSFISVTFSSGHEIKEFILHIRYLNDYESVSLNMPQISDVNIIPEANYLL